MSDRSELEKAIAQQVAHQEKKRGVDVRELEAVRDKSARLRQNLKVAGYVAVALLAAAAAALILLDPQDRQIYIFSLLVFGLWAAWRLWHKKA
ncbi:MAG: hypothetical protein ACYCW6_31240 [Candidatus Xenobia bacterium]